MSVLPGVAWLQSYWSPPQEIRREIFALGARHQGRVIEGARKEIMVSGVSFRRARLLKAVIRQQSRSVAGKAELAEQRP